MDPIIIGLGHGYADCSGSSTEKSPSMNVYAGAVAESVLNAGYPAPVEVDVSPFSYFAGSPPAFTVPVKKPRYHATIRFEHPVTGPVIAGRLRYFGIGLFRPVS